MRKSSVLMALVVVLAACAGGGYTQAEVDDLVAQAVDKAVSEQSDLVSEQDAQAQADEAVKQASLQAAVDECLRLEGGSTAYITVDEGGLVMEGEGEESAGVAYTTIACVLAELDVPDSIVTRMENTNSTMGIVEGSWGDYEASWSYHPDNGFFVHVVVVG